MKFSIFSLALILLIGCSKKNEFPEEFVGTWTFDVNSLYRDIEKKALPEDEEKALKYSFGDIEKNQTCTVTEKGTFRYPQFEGVYIQLKVVSQTEEGYLFREQNSMNPSVSEYSLNKIENGVWESILVTEDLKPIHPELPNTYWTNQSLVSTPEAAPLP